MHVSSLQAIKISRPRPKHQRAKDVLKHDVYASKVVLGKEHFDEETSRHFPIH